jgi:cysteinyl-tRNA synthetase
VQRCSDLLQPVTAVLASGDKNLATLGAATAALAEALAASSWDVQKEYLMLARRFEREFFDDMDALGVQRPDVVTRVSEFVPQVVTYIQAIIDKGAAERGRLLWAYRSYAHIRRLGIRVARVRVFRCDGVHFAPATLLREAA